MNFSTSSKLTVDELIANAKKVFVAELRVNTKSLEILRRYEKPDALQPTIFPSLHGIPIVACLPESSEPLVEIVWRFRLEDD